RAERRFLPAAPDVAVLSQTGEERVDRALGRDHAFGRGEPSHDVEPVRLPRPEQRQHAVFDDAAVELGGELRGTPGRYHVSQGTLRATGLAMQSRKSFGRLPRPISGSRHVRSNAPSSHFAPCGRAIPRWSFVAMA